jgi:hypothetical protein
MQLFSKMKIVLLCFSISFCYATRINAESGQIALNVKYDKGSNPSIAFISSGEYAGKIAEVHQASIVGSSGLWFDILDTDIQEEESLTSSMIKDRVHLLHLFLRVNMPVR